MGMVNGAWCELIPFLRILPTIILMVTFGGLAGNTNIVSGASECSCWCIPELGNVLPYAIPRDQVCLVNANNNYFMIVCTFDTAHCWVCVAHCKAGGFFWLLTIPQLFDCVHLTCYSVLENHETHKNTQRRLWLAVLLAFCLCLSLSLSLNYFIIHSYSKCRHWFRQWYFTASPLNSKEANHLLSIDLHCPRICQ